MGIREIGTDLKGHPVRQIEIASDRLRCKVLTFGARIQNLETAVEGRFVSVLLGYPTLSQYLSDSVHMGALVGRVAGRISKSRYTLGGETHTLIANEGANQLHGGPKGFSFRTWDLVSHSSSQVKLRLVSRHGDQGHPGELVVELQYEIEDNELKVHFSAKSDRLTPLSLTSHGYFHLGELVAPHSIDNHHLELASPTFLEADRDNVVTGQRIETAQTRERDFPESRPIGPTPLDHAYVIESRVNDPCAKLLSPNRRLEMQVFTSLPVMQICTADFLSQEANAFPPRSAICIEPQMYPDALNRPEFPSSLLHPCQDRQDTIRYVFISKA